MIFDSKTLIFKKISHSNEINMTNYYKLQLPPLQVIKILPLIRNLFEMNFGKNYALIKIISLRFKVGFALQAVTFSLTEAKREKFTMLTHRCN